MYCPVCDDIRMREVEKDGVLIDICPNCKGVWLDRGELDKLSSRVKEVRRPFNDWYEQEQHDDDRKVYKDRDYNEDSYYDKGKYRDNVPRRKKKKSVMDMLGDIFD
jgi:Zn-finger nucleic acid-binding protein